MNLNLLSPLIVWSVLVSSNSKLPLGATDIFDINYLTLELFKGATYIPESYESLSLSAGSYTAKVSGMGAGTIGGLYTFSAISAPVPEANTLTLMLAGFGLVGFMSYRRRNLI